MPIPDFLKKYYQIKPITVPKPILPNVSEIKKYTIPTIPLPTLPKTKVTGTVGLGTFFTNELNTQLNKKAEELGVLPVPKVDTQTIWDKVKSVFKPPILNQRFMDALKLQTQMAGNQTPSDIDILMTGLSNAAGITAVGIMIGQGINMISSLRQSVIGNLTDSVKTVEKELPKLGVSEWNGVDITEVTPKSIDAINDAIITRTPELNKALNYLTTVKDSFPDNQFAYSFKSMINGYLGQLPELTAAPVPRQKSSEEKIWEQVNKAIIDTEAERTLNIKAQQVGNVIDKLSSLSQTTTAEIPTLNSVINSAKTQSLSQFTTTIKNLIPVFQKVMNTYPGLIGKKSTPTKKQLDEASTFLSTFKNDKSISDFYNKIAPEVKPPEKLQPPVAQIQKDIVSDNTNNYLFHTTSISRLLSISKNGLWAGGVSTNIEATMGEEPLGEGVAVFLKQDFQKYKNFTGGDVSLIKDYIPIKPIATFTFKDLGIIWDRTGQSGVIPPDIAAQEQAIRDKILGITTEKLQPPVAQIPKELEPLAIEARKYKSAEEFADSQLQKTLGEMPTTKTAQREWFQKRIELEKFYNQVVKPISQPVAKKPIVYSIRKAIYRRKDGYMLVGGGGRIFDTDKNVLEQIKTILQQYDMGKITAQERSDQVSKLLLRSQPPTTQAEVKPQFAGTETKPITITEKPKGIGMGGVNPIEKVIQALKEAKPLRKEQEKIYTQERTKRIAKAKEAGKIGGEAGYYAELGQLKGEMLKVQFESIRFKITQEDIDALFNLINNSSLLPFQQITTKAGLLKLLGEYGGVVPTEGELKLLNKVFGSEFTKTVSEMRPLLDQLKNAGLQLINIPRALMASFDFSAPLRQGIFLMPSHPKEFIFAFGNMFRYTFSEKNINTAMDIMAKDPDFPLAMEYKLALTDINGTLTDREEVYMSSWAEKIPLIGKGVRASDRAYTGFLNYLRFYTWKSMLNNFEKAGLNPRDDPKTLKDLASLVGSGTGRGDLPDFLKSAQPLLNGLLFSPRLMAARVNLLRPDYYAKLDPPVRKEALKSLLAFLTFGFTVLGLATLAFKNKVKVGTDWRSADFGKIKIGNTRIDIWGGFQQYARLVGQLVTGQYISTTTGVPMTLGEGYKPLTRFDILLRFFEYKEAPFASLITDLLKGQTAIGEPLTWKKEILDRLTPMVFQDFIDLAKDNPDLLPLGIFGIFGVGLQTYDITYTKSEQVSVDQLTKQGMPKEEIKRLVIEARITKQIKTQIGFVKSNEGLTDKQKLDKINKLTDLYNTLIKSLKGK